jgi:hypothetical protein
MKFIKNIWIKFLQKIIMFMYEPISQFMENLV